MSVNLRKHQNELTRSNAVNVVHYVFAIVLQYSVVSSHQFNTHDATFGHIP